MPEPRTPRTPEHGAVRPEDGRPERPAVFFDRDGTLTVENDWVRSARDLVLLEGAAEAIVLVRRAGYAAVLITNQSAVARGIITESELSAIHDELVRRLEEKGARMDGIYACPHHPTEGVLPYRRECDCRKPKSGLIERAARELDLDLDHSWIVGDAERDLRAGERLGIPGILVATGKGAGEHARLSAAGAAPLHYCTDVGAAAKLILELDQGR